MWVLIYTQENEHLKVSKVAGDIWQNLNFVEYSPKLSCLDPQDILDTLLTEIQRIMMLED